MSFQPPSGLNRVKGVFRVFQVGKWGKSRALSDKGICILLKLIFVYNYHNDIGFINKNIQGGLKGV